MKRLRCLLGRHRWAEVSERWSTPGATSPRGEPLDYVKVVERCVWCGTRRGKARWL